MTTPSSTTVATAVSDSAGDTATLSLSPTGFSGMSVAAAGGQPTASMAIASTGAATMGGTTSTSSASVSANASTTQVVTDVTNVLGAEGTLTVGAQQVTAATNPGTATPVSVINNLGFVSTVTPDPSAGGSTTFVRQCSNTKSEFYGVGVLRDAQTAPQQNAAAVCTIPVPHNLLGTNVVQCRIEAVIICKCTVQGSVTDPNTGFPSPAVGDYYMTKGFSEWVNKNGTLSAARFSLSGSIPASSVITNPIWNTTDERGTPIQSYSPNWSYAVGPILVAVTSPGADTLAVQAQPLFGISFTSFGTTVCEIFATAFYN